MDLHLYVQVPTNDEEKSAKEIDAKAPQPTTFEGAISATGYGKFNVFLLVANVFASLVQVLETLNMSFVIPIAHCDLDLRLEDKGALNAACFTGMILSGFFWGYLCDTFGRKKIIVYGYLVQTIFAVMAAFSTSFTYLFVTKFFIGLILNGPYSASISYLTEFHSAEYRSRIQLVRGIILSVSNIFLPLLAWVILPREWAFKIGSLDFHSWNFFLLVCSLLPLTTGIVYSFLPESPKYLMSMGRNKEALEVLRRVYVINNDKDENSYPVVTLQEEISSTGQGDKKTSFKDGIAQMKPLFRTPYMVLLLISCFNAFSLSTSSNTLKVWLPQLFQAISDYQVHHNGSSSSLCIMLGELTPSNSSTRDVTDCTVNLENTSVYTNSMAVSMMRVLAFLVTVWVNGFVASKHLSIVLAFANAIFSGMLYFAHNSMTVLVLSSMVSGFGSVDEVLLINIALELFPTTLRTLAISIHLSSMRIGILVGNLLFPHLLMAGCAHVFLYISIMSLCCSVASFLYPNTDNKPLL